MKKIFIVLLLICSIFIFSCKKEAPNEEKDDPQPNNGTEIIDNHEDDNKDDEEENKDPVLNPSIVLNDDDLILFLNDTHELSLTKVDNPSYSFDYDHNYLKVENDIITPLKEGETSLSLIFNEEVIKKIKINIYEKPDKLEFIDFPETIEAGLSTKIKMNNSHFKIDLDNPDLATYSEKTKYLTAKKEGVLIVTATYLYDEDIFAEKVLVITPKIPNATVTLVDSSYSSLTNGTKVIIDNVRYTYGTNLFASIKDALAKSSKILVKKTSETSVNINSGSVRIEGCSEDNFNLKFVIAEKVDTVKISKFNFTLDSKIVLSGGNTNIEITDNNFINTTVNSTAWAAGNTYKSGIIELTNYSDKYHNNIYIKNNKFNNIGDCGVNVNTTHNLYVEGNSFNTFTKDAVRMNNGVIKEECMWSFSNNTFIDSSYSGLYFRTYAPSSAGFYHFIDIRDNLFDNLGRSNEEFSGAIVFRNYQEAGASINIAYNSFNNCSRFIFLRNNAVVDNQKNFNAYVMGNIFKSIPSKYYFNNLNSSDSVSTNPVQTKLIDNVYLNDSGLDITPDNAKFIGAKTNTILLKNKLDNYHHFNLRHVYKVGDEIELEEDITFNDSSYYSFTNHKLKILKEGISQIYCGDASFEIIALKDSEMIVKFIQIALGELGYKEMDANGNTGTSGNYTKYGAWYGINPGAWCAMYVSWCANQAGVPTTIIPKYASVQLGMEWYQNKKLFQYKENYTPKAGDIMFQKSSGASHTGIVLYCDGTTLYTVEGNTSDMCALRQYSVTNAKITGYGTPEWPYYSPDGYNFSSGKVDDGGNHSTT